MKRVISSILALFVVGFICLQISPDLRAQTGPESTFSKDLRLKYSEMSQKKEFEKLLDYFNALKFQAQSEADNQDLDYYVALTKSACLDYLESSENWEQYYDKVDAYNEDIIALSDKHLNDADPSGAVISLHYLAWKADLRDDDEEDAKVVFKELVKSVIDYTERFGDTGKFAEVAQLISKEGRGAQINLLFKGYTQYLLDSKAPAASIERLSEIAQNYLAQNEVDTAINIYENYIQVITAKYDRTRLITALRSVAEKFRCTGFSAAKNAEFAEKIYRLIVKNGGEEALTEKDILVRGFNLESMGSYEQALKLYSGFLDKYAQSGFAPEVLLRTAIIDLYFVKNKGKAETALKKIISDYSSSEYLFYAKYWLAVLYQLEGLPDEAGRLYADLIAQENEFSESAKQRLEEINSGAGLPDSLKRPFSFIYSEQGVSEINMSLKSEPARVFVNDELFWQATALDFSSGTIQPQFVFEWFGDTGSAGDPGNVTEFNTTYETAFPKLVSFSAKAYDSENMIFGSVWVYDIKISVSSPGKKFKMGMPLKFSAQVLPQTIENDGFSWQWQVSGPETLSRDGNSFNYRFQNPGLYEAEVIVSAGGVTGKKKFAFEITE